MALKTALYTHENCFLHSAGEGHPESRQRLEKVLKAVKGIFPDAKGEKAEWVEVSKATKDHILLAHTQNYWDKLSKIANGLKEGDAPVNIDEDTRISAYSLDAALYGVGAGCQAVDDLVANKYRNAFCMTRPPGHHAVKDSSMGFCLFGNVAIAAKYALTKKEIKKVAIIDFDVHQGNGTEDLVKDSPDILFFSLHQGDLWPYQHHADQGEHGTINNIAVPMKSDPALYHQIFDDVVIPKLNAWKPDLVIISAGFDAHRDDPPKEEALFNDPPGRQMLLEKDFNLMTKKLMDVAKIHSKGRVLSMLEGGYNTDVLARCCAEHAKTLAE